MNEITVKLDFFCARHFSQLELESIQDEAVFKEALRMSMQEQMIEWLRNENNSIIILNTFNNNFDRAWEKFLEERKMLSSKA